MAGIGNFLNKLKNNISRIKNACLSSGDVERQHVGQANEEEYRLRLTMEYISRSVLALPDDPLWNTQICVMVLVAIVCLTGGFTDPLIDFFDSCYNGFYAFHIVALAYSLLHDSTANLDLRIMCGFLLDTFTFTHYLFDTDTIMYKLVCYYLRLHRAFEYLWANDYTLNGSVVGTALKYCYLFLVLRLSFALIWLYADVENDKLGNQYTSESGGQRDVRMFDKQNPSRFLKALYIVNKIFVPIGPSNAPTNDLQRVAFLVVMITGCLVVTGAAVASLSLVIGVYMRSEETFRTRYRLIMKEMETSNVPQSLRDKVETFYKMYWHKQRAVSATQLLPIFPPSLSTTVYTDIYFKATQKSRILCELSYQFLSELAKKMETIHYIPGDSIIKRNQKKSSIIYITYGDIEMLTAEDDNTAILRMIRGTILSPCAGSPAAGCGHAYVEIRAATFCTAHVLRSSDLWKTVLKYGTENGQGAIILGSFYEHFERVKRHYYMRLPEQVKYKSSILHFKRNLMDLKESKDAAGNLQLSQTDVMLDVAGCYVMRNRADASLTDEADAICLRPTFPCILQPNSSLQVVWHSFVTCLIIIVCLTHPYYLVYKKNVPLEFRFYDYMVTLVYILDLIVHLSTGANVEDGVPITLTQTSSQQSRSRWFLLDIIGTLPILELIGDGHFAGLNKLLRLPKVFRMLKTVEDECVYHTNILRFFSYSLLLLISCYLLAALQQGFMCFQFGYCLVSNFTHSPFWEKKGLDEETVEGRIIFGLYWAISMITFTSHMETWGTDYWNNIIYTLFVLEICIVLYIFIESVYSATIMVTTALREDYDACIENVSNFLIRNEVDPLLRSRFIEYLQLCWYTDKGYSMTNKQSSIFYDLPPHVYQDIVARQRSKFILCIPFMKLLHKEVLKNISSQARLFCTSPNEILLNTGDMCNEIYVIKRGICEIISPETKDVVGELSIRSHFGVLECLLRLPAFYTVRAVTHVEVFTISRKHLVNVIDIPQIREALESSKEQPQFTHLLTRRDPFIGYQPPEPTPNMERFRYPRKYEQDNAFLQPFHRMGLLSALRYIFPRFTIRPDGRYLVHFEWFRAGCAFLSAMIYPGYTYFVLQWPWLYFIALLLDLAAYFDILQRMLVGYYNEYGVLVYHPASTAGHYLRGAFIVDLFGCLPLERLESSWKESFYGSYRETPTKQFLMLNRLFQLYRMPSALLGLSGLVRRDILLVISAMPLFLALLNVLTCLVVYSSVNIFFTEYSSNGSWFILPLKDKGGSWINLFHSTFRFNLTETPWNLHLGSLFWVVYETTSTGFGTFKPTNFNLMRVLTTGMIIGAIIITYYSVRIISVRANVNKALASFQEHMKDIAVFMKRENLDQQLQRQVQEYYEYNWDKMGGTDYRNVLKLCQQITLRTDAILHIYGSTFTKCPILTQCDISLLRIIGRAVRSFYFLKGTTIIEEDDIVADIYFVDRGTVDLREPGDEDSFITLNKGSMFGNLEGASTIRCQISMSASSQVHLLQINSQAFFSIISDFPAVLKLLNYYRPFNENYIEGLTSSLPFNITARSATSTLKFRGQGLVNYLNIRHSVIRVYLIIVCLICIYADVYNAGFQDNKLLIIIILYFLDFCFLWKFIIQYILPQMIEIDEDVLKTLMRIRKNYIKYEFKYDLISVLPVEVLSLLTNNRGLWFSWLRLNRLFRIVTVYKCLQQHHRSISINLILSTAVTVLIWFTVFVHIAACFWYFLGMLEEQNEPKSSWIYNNQGNPLCENNYICSLYFILTTFSQNGVGDIMPKRQAEVAFVVMLQVVSTMTYMVYVGELSNIIQYKSFRCFNYYSKYLELQSSGRSSKLKYLKQTPSGVSKSNASITRDGIMRRVLFGLGQHLLSSAPSAAEFLRNNRVSKNLVSIVNRYSLHLWRESRGLQLPHFLTTAPNCLKLKVMSAAYLYHLTDHPIFTRCEPAFLRQLVGSMKLYTYNEEMYVVKEREITGAMYIIHTGKVRGICETTKKAKAYHAGRYFGELQGLIHDLPFTHSYITTTKSQILTLYLKDWEGLLEHFPKSKNFIFTHLDNNYNSRGEKPDDGWKSDDQPSSSPLHDVSSLTSRIHSATSSSSPSSKEGKQKGKPRVFFPPPGPSQTRIKTSSVDNNKTFAWPIDSKRSSTSFSSVSGAPTQERDGQDLAEPNIKVRDSIKEFAQENSKLKRTFPIEKVTPGPSKAEILEEHTSSYDSITVNKEDSMNERTPLTQRFRYKLTSELKSVEDYILEQYGSESEIRNRFDNESSPVDIKEQFKEPLPSPSHKKGKSHVRYQDTESHELKPIRNMTAEEDNLSSHENDVSVEKKEKPEVSLSEEIVSSDSDLTNKHKAEKSRKNK